MVVQSKAPEQEPKPDVIVGDHVFYRHKNGDRSGRVIAIGKHGVTLHSEKEHHKVKWDGVLGHKKRATQHYNIVEHGEDGHLVGDAAGNKRFLRIENEAKADPLVAKATKPGGPVAGRPGLQKKEITDKTGRKQTKWVRVDKKMGQPNKGAHIGFKNGEHHGHGQVKSVGRDGVTVADRAGGTHRVEHAQVTHHWIGDDAPTESPHNQPTAANLESEPFFNPDEVDHLPRKAVQPTKDFDELFSKAKECEQEFASALGGIQKSLGLASGQTAGEMTDAQWDDDKSYLFVGPMKSAKRAKEKAAADYIVNGKPDYSRLTDVIRATIAVPTIAHAHGAMAEIKRAGLTLAQTPKDRFANPTEEGYRDLMMIVKLPSGFMAELQLHVKPMSKAKNEGHALYAITRDLQGKYHEKEPSAKWDEKDRAAFADALKSQRALYEQAWAVATAKGKKKKTTLLKSDQRRIIILWK